MRANLADTVTTRAAAITPNQLPQAYHEEYSKLRPYNVYLLLTAADRGGQEAGGALHDSFATCARSEPPLLYPVLVDVRQAMLKSMGIDWGQPAESSCKTPQPPKSDHEMPSPRGGPNKRPGEVEWPPGFWYWSYHIH